MVNARLSSWKEIAAYLKCDESTARRWRRENDLPVYSVGNKGSSVHAFTDELDRWVRERNQVVKIQATEQEADLRTSSKLLGIPDTSSLSVGHAQINLQDSTPKKLSASTDVSLPEFSAKNRYWLAGVWGVGIGLFILSLSAILLLRHSTFGTAGQPTFKVRGGDQGLVDIHNINNSAMSDQNQEETAIHLKRFVKETQIWEMLTLYAAPWDCDARDLKRYWLPGSKAFDDIGASVSRLNERGWHYGYDSRLFDFQFRYVRISPDGSSAVVGTREHWWLPVYTHDEQSVPNRNADQGPYEIEYLLTKTNGAWYIKSTSTPYIKWKPTQITCRNWPSEMQQP